MKQRVRQTRVDRLFIHFLLLLVTTMCLSSCTGYRFSPEERPSRCKTISVSYISGDTLGIFTDELIHAIASSSQYVYQREGGDITLQVAITGNGNERIGYNYDSKGKIGKLQKNLIGVEGRNTVSAQVSAIDSCTGKNLVIPGIVSFHADYDIADYNSINDLSNINSKGVRQSSIAFSLGQLDTVEGATADVAILIYRQLAQKIVASFLAAPKCD